MNTYPYLRCLDCGKLFRMIGGYYCSCPICHSEKVLEIDEEELYDFKTEENEYEDQ